MSAVGDHGRRNGGRAKAVIPVRVRQRDRDDLRPATGGKLGRERAQVCNRRPTLDEQRAALAVDGAERGPVGAIVRAEPVDVGGDLLEDAVGHGGDPTGARNHERIAAPR